MKKLYSLYLLLTVVCINSATRAQNFNVIDINKSTDAYPQNYQQAAVKSQYAVLDNIVSFFEANDGIHGGEVWRSDGTAGGTYMLKDINPGTGWSNPNDIIVSGEKIFFSANEYTHGYKSELWMSDGTKTGTKRITQITSDAGNGNPTDLTDDDGTVYFFTDYGSAGSSELWKTDGTSSGTQKIVNFYKSEYGFGGAAQDMVNVNGRLFFAMFTTGNGFQLWTSDGTKEGTMQLTTINTVNYYGCTPFNLTAVNGLLYFGLDDGTGTRLYMSDGTIVGTKPVKNAADFNIDRTNIPFVVRSNTIFFAAYSNDAGEELCKYSKPGNNSIKIVKDIVSGTDGSYPYNITNVNGTIYFTAVYGSDYAVWKTDGSDAGTELVKDINPGGANDYYGFTAAKNKLMFAYSNNISGFELWESDGTDAGTQIVKDNYPGIYGGYPDNVTYINDFILFSSFDGVHGDELWRSDGTEAGTVLLKDINTSATSSSSPFTFEGGQQWGKLGIVTQNNKLLFSADDKQYGDNELFVSDGTGDGTYRLKDIDSGSGGSFPLYYANLKSETYFFARPTNSFYTQLFKSDGTPGGTVVIPLTDLENVINNNGYLENMIATDNLLYILAFNYSTYQNELWRSDGTSEGTYLVQSLSPYYSTLMATVGNTLFFTNYDDTNGYELWKTDGTVAGTKITRDLATGSYNSDPSLLTAYNGKIYFAAHDEFYNYYLCSSDGTKAGTRKIKSVSMDYSFQPAVANGKLFFYANDYGPYGDELWSTNGTSGGTKMVKDINKGQNGSNTYGAAAFPVDNLIYFEAYDGISGTGLWKSDGTAKGTQLLKEVSLASSYYYSFPIANVNGRLFFLDDRDSLWTSDGTDAGTVKVTDANLANVSNIYDLTAMGDKLFFSGYTDATGQELYAGSASNMQNKTGNNFSSVSSTKINTGLITFPNPAKDVLNVKINSNNNYAGLFVTDVSGKTILNRTMHNGETLIQLDVSRLSSGTYFIKLISADGNEKAISKFIKE